MDFGVELCSEAAGTSPKLCPTFEQAAKAARLGKLGVLQIEDLCCRPTGYFPLRICREEQREHNASKLCINVNCKISQAYLTHQHLLITTPSGDTNETQIVKNLVPF